ncbi:hypothetical protein LIER_20484 [Lithospermum erythrorhizon]|uniref:Uncharacterized protein n=1 Tax=Lithospermum erythrorhizon TaxID=34254 RepID=A0AAV3QSA9_LITER
MELYGAFGNNDFCRSIPKEFLMERWSRNFAKPSSKIDNYSCPEPSSYGQRYQRINNLMNSAAPRVCFIEEAYLCYVRYMLDSSKESVQILQNSTSVSAPSRADCLSAIGMFQFYIVYLTLFLLTLRAEF